MKNNTFKRIAAGALATISVATNVMSANVGGNVLVDSIRATLVASAADETEQQQYAINFDTVLAHIDSITVEGADTYNKGQLTLLLNGALKSAKGKTITVKSDTALKINKKVAETKTVYAVAGEEVEVFEGKNSTTPVKKHIKPAQTIDNTVDYKNQMTLTIDPTEPDKYVFVKEEDVAQAETVESKASLTPEDTVGNYKLFGKDSIREEVVGSGGVATKAFFKEASNEEINANGDKFGYVDKEAVNAGGSFGLNAALYNKLKDDDTAKFYKVETAKGTLTVENASTVDEVVAELKKIIDKKANGKKFEERPATENGDIKWGDILQVERYDQYDLSELDELQNLQNPQYKKFDFDFNHYEMLGTDEKKTAYINGLKAKYQGSVKSVTINPLYKGIILNVANKGYEGGSIFYEQNAKPEILDTNEHELADLAGLSFYSADKLLVDGTGAIVEMVLEEVEKDNLPTGVTADNQAEKLADYGVEYKEFAKLTDEQVADEKIKKYIKDAGEAIDATNATFSFKINTPDTFFKVPAGNQNYQDAVTLTTYEADKAPYNATDYDTFKAHLDKTLYVFDEGTEITRTHNVPLTEENDSLTKSIDENGQYTYTFKMPENQVAFDTAVFNFAEQPADNILGTITPDRITNNAGELGYISGTDMIVTSTEKQYLDIVTYKYAKDANGNKIQLTDANGNLIYMKGADQPANVVTANKAVSDKISDLATAASLLNIDNYTEGNDARTTYNTASQDLYNLVKGDATNFAAYMKKYSDALTANSFDLIDKLSTAAKAQADMGQAEAAKQAATNDDDRIVAQNAYDKAAAAYLDAMDVIGDIQETMLQIATEANESYNKKVPNYYILKNAKTADYGNSDLYNIFKANPVYVDDTTKREIKNFNQVNVYNDEIDKNTVAQEGDKLYTPYEVVRNDYTPVYKIEAVKVKTTRTSEGSGVNTRYKYAFDMPDLEDCVISDELYSGIKQFVYIQKHTHTDEWEYSTSVDGTELYRQCKSDDLEACPENGEKLLIAMIRNKVGEGEYNKITDFTYTEGINPVLLTLVFDSDGTPTVENGKLKYYEKQLTVDDAFVVKNYEDTKISLEGTFDGTQIGNYVVKFTPTNTTIGDVQGNADQEKTSLYPAGTLDADKYELTYYFAVNEKELTIDNVVATQGTEYDANKHIFNVDPTGRLIEDIDFKIVDNDKELKINQDYIIVGTTKSDIPGEYTFRVKGIGNYTGDFEVKWNLKLTAASKELTADMVKIETISHGTYAERRVTVHGLDEYGRINEKVIVPVGSYEISGSEYATEKGVYDFTIKGNGQYYGVLNLKWDVTRADITGETAVVDGAHYDASTKKLEISSVSALKEYNGEPIENQTLIAAGIVATKEFELAENMDINSNDDKTIYVRSKSGAEVEGKKSFVLTWRKSNSTANDVWYVKPYTQFKIGTKTITVYGDLTRVQGDTYKVMENGSAQVRTTKSKVTNDETNTGKKVLSTNAYLAIPDGCTMMKAGIIASTTKEKAVNKTVSVNEAQNTANDLFVRFKEGNDVAPYQRYNFTWRKTNLADNAVYHVKPFVQYKDADGAIHTVYGDVTEMKVSEFLKN